MGGNRFLASIRPYALYMAWIVSIVAAYESLYLSEIMHYEPCKLCWFQRIFMYPEVILLGIASYKNDRKIIPYAMTLSIIGAASPSTITWSRKSLRWPKPFRAPSGSRAISIT